MYVLYIIFETEAWLLSPVRFDQSGCVPALTVQTSHEVCTNVRIRSPGDVIRPPNIQGEILLPGSIDWAPPHTATTGVISSTHESTVLQSVSMSATICHHGRQHAGGPGWWVIYLGSGPTRDKNGSWNVDIGSQYFSIAKMLLDLLEGQTFSGMSWMNGYEIFHIYLTCFELIIYNWIVILNFLDEII